MNLLYKYHRRAGLLQKSRKTILYQYYINRYVSIMKSYKFLNKCLKDRKDENKKKGIQNLRQKRQSKINVFHFYKKCKKNCGKLNKKMEAATKKFWKMMKSFFPDRIISKKQTSLVKLRKLFQKIVM